MRRAKAFDLYNQLLDCGYTDKNILEFILFHSMSGNEALLSLEQFKKEYIDSIDDYNASIDQDNQRYEDSHK